MAYITTQEVKQIREKLKEEFPEFKWSVRREHGMKVSVAIMEGKDTFKDILGEQNSMSVTPYFMSDHYSPERIEFLTKVFDIIKFGSDNKYFDESDAMTDYFNTAFYFDLSIGRWDKPYKLIK